MDDFVNAFIKLFTIEPTHKGSLSGLTFAVKDLFDVAGYVTAYGNPTWAKTHSAANTHADVVIKMLHAGATLVGKTHTDELAYSLMGVNEHYGTPINTSAVDRLPGGSSSGSAAATIANLVDIGIGSDTGGSVRLPASFCGLWGIRTTHGVLSLAGARDLAPSFDTLGWFTRDAESMAAVAQALGLTLTKKRAYQLYMPQDVWNLLDTGMADVFKKPLIQISEKYSSINSTHISLSTPLSQWRSCFQICQAYEIWQCHGEWIRTAKPIFGSGVKERFEKASQISYEQAKAAQNIRQELQLTIEDLLQENGILVIPTSPSIAPKRDASPNVLDDFRTRALEMLSIAGISGLPQLSIPVVSYNDAPIGLSLVGPRGSDMDLITIAKNCFAKA